MASFEDIVRLYRVERVELHTWIERRWVRPHKTADGFDFDEIDEARISLIRELQRDLVPDPDGLSIVLSLLDQLYEARRALHSVEDAITALPEDLRAQILDRLRHPRPR